MALEGESLLCHGEHSFVSSQITFVYTVSGQGPVLIIQPPGWGVGGDLYRGTFGPLAKRFTLVTLDPRGSGKSAKPASDSAMGSWDMANDIEALRLHLHLESLMILGHSNGGCIALAYAEKYSTRVSKLVLVDFQVLGYSDAAVFAAFAEARKDHPVYGPALASFKKMRDNQPETVEEFSKGLIEMIPFYFGMLDNLPTLIQRIQEGGPPSLYARRTQSAADELWVNEGGFQMDNLGKVSANTYMVFGKQDSICPVSIGQKVKDVIPLNELVVYDTCGHFPWIEKPDQFFTGVINFLE